MKSKGEELKKEVYEYWKKNEKLTLDELNEKMNTEYFKTNNCDISHSKYSLLQWLKKENSRQ
ncbi:hypothetical protein CLOBY_26940 [Clostridium saccharobutylicum]|uniref:hypothetical protein n=1 Tax=Clostridium saccharobutylicum TaxID=169679 RepID=UPI000983D784|nr:hypothetical protein [Clostridium saccharobutylicum]AQS10549.1 hypothetical protein CLOBY_26940 [Clostridium saccharobutylicum]MBC2438094.1 hypothetical protein [Clostridium saccharobutylicum]NSB90448.1 hypothetical protein [Clostridium saccharobutylicum]NYC31503.1 hypothetical protein [Clostridium saccharobutylicum]OOM18822.1 hypothetical protein CLSAB_02800 [Clostridium saccharobutylicum]